MEKEYKTADERLDNGLCPLCEGTLVKASSLGSHHDDKTPTCEDCGWTDVDY